jgi:hypothetical protein
MPIKLFQTIFAMFEDREIMVFNEISKVLLNRKNCFKKGAGA